MQVIDSLMDILDEIDFINLEELYKMTVTFLICFLGAGPQIREMIGLRQQWFFYGMVFMFAGLYYLSFAKKQIRIYINAFKKQKEEKA